MEYQKRGGIGGAWLEKTMDLNGKRAKLVSETKPIESDRGYGMQDIAKIQVEGDKEVRNIRINKPSINALIDAYGDDSKNWVNQVLTIGTEKALVSGKRVIALYLVPEGFELVEDSGGYLVITRKGQKPDEMPEDEIVPDEIPF